MISIPEQLWLPRLLNAFGRFQDHDAAKLTGRLPEK